MLDADLMEIEIGGEPVVRMIPIKADDNLATAARDGIMTMQPMISK